MRVQEDQAKHALTKAGDEINVALEYLDSHPFEGLEPVSAPAPAPAPPPAPAPAEAAELQAKAKKGAELELAGDLQRALELYEQALAGWESHPPGTWGRSSKITSLRARVDHCHEAAAKRIAQEERLAQQEKKEQKERMAAILEVRQMGLCSICMDGPLHVGSLCTDATCATGEANWACGECLSAYFTSLVDSALYAAPALLCQAEGCGSRIPVRRWSRVVVSPTDTSQRYRSATQTSTACWGPQDRQTVRSFEENASALLSLRCGSCDTPRSLLPSLRPGLDTMSARDATVAALAEMDASALMDSQQLSRAWRGFAQGRLSPAEMASELCDILDTEFGAPDPGDPYSLNEARERVWSLLGLVHDVERRASLAMAYLNLRPGVATCDQLALCLAFVVYESLLALYSAASHVVMAGQGVL